MQCLILHENVLHVLLVLEYMYMKPMKAREKKEEEEERRRRRRRRKRRRTSGYVNKFSSTNMVYCYHIMPE